MILQGQCGHSEKSFLHSKWNLSFWKLLPKTRSNILSDENIYWPWFKYLTQFRSSFGVNSSNVFISMFVCVERETGGADNFVLRCSPFGILCINSTCGVFYAICSRYAMCPEIACLLHFYLFALYWHEILRAKNSTLWTVNICS